ncbi:MAG TPA: NADH-quinone oxidoreductase subunit M [Dehalococcoidia bacterium]|nr:NADH-quinone oxidoreductase subunit M [Dehalococcoidia bacterium]
MSSFYLTAILFIPILGLILIAFLPKDNARPIKWTALIATLASFIISLVVFVQFDRSPAAVGGMQFVEKLPWIPALNVHYHLGVDGLSLPLVILMTFLGVLVVLVSWKITLRPKEYFIWIMLLETSILGVFMSLDLVLFFIFWELELFPMYFLISIWGSGRKEYSSTKYVIYTLIGSAFMLAGFLTVYFTTGTMNMLEVAQGLSVAQPLIPAAALFFLLFIGFSIKLPMFPFHTWLPDAHTDAPTAVSVILAGSLLKMGGYGMIRLVVSILPDIARQLSPLLVLLAIIGVLYGAAITLRQTDLKRLIAYSSVSHMGYVLLGIFALNQISLTGAALQMFSHGIITGLLFAMVGLVYEKTHNRNLNALGGLARQMPVIVVVFSIAGLASLGLPGTSGFIAEFTTFIGSFSSTAFNGIQIYTVLGILGVVLTAGYILWMLQKTFYGPPQDKYNGVPDADLVEKICIFSFVAAILLVGVYPAILTDIIQMGIEPVARLFGM